MKHTIALSFDVELWNETDWLIPYVDATTDNDVSFETSIHTILNALKKRGHHATFFVTSRIVEHYPELVKKIANEGHEVGSHGVDHARLTTVDRETYAIAFKKHINDIIQITGKQPKGFRAPHFSLTETTSWMIDLLTECGLSYDSSIFPLSLGEYGNSRAPKPPYAISPKHISKHTEGAPIREFPISVSSFAGIPVPYAGGIYFRILPLFLFRYFLNKETRKEHPPVLYFHPHELEATTPKITRGPFLRRFLKYFGTTRSFRKFEKLLDWYIVDSLEAIYHERS